MRFRRLTPENHRKVNALVRTFCCNYFDGNCILLDNGEPCVCPQSISNGSEQQYCQMTRIYTQNSLYPTTERNAPYAVKSLFHQQTRRNIAINAE